MVKMDNILDIVFHDISSSQDGTLSILGFEYSTQQHIIGFSKLDGRKTETKQCT